MSEFWLHRRESEWKKREMNYLKSILWTKGVIAKFQSTGDRCNLNTKIIVLYLKRSINPNRCSSFIRSNWVFSWFHSINNHAGIRIYIHSLMPSRILVLQPNVIKILFVQIIYIQLVGWRWIWKAWKKYNTGNNYQFKYYGQPLNCICVHSISLLSWLKDDVYLISFIAPCEANFRGI